MSITTFMKHLGLLQAFTRDPTTFIYLDEITWKAADKKAAMADAQPKCCFWC